MPGFFYNYALDKNGFVWSPRNVCARAGITTVYMAILTLIACLVPFFGCACPALIHAAALTDVCFLRMWFCTFSVVQIHYCLAGQHAMKREISQCS